MSESFVSFQRPPSGAGGLFTGQFKEMVSSMGAKKSVAADKVVLTLRDDTILQERGAKTHDPRGDPAPPADEFEDIESRAAAASVQSDTPYTYGLGFRQILQQINAAVKGMFGIVSPDGRSVHTLSEAGAVLSVLSSGAVLYWLGSRRGLYTHGLGWSTRPLDYVYFAGVAVPMVTGASVGAVSVTLHALSGGR